MPENAWGGLVGFLMGTHHFSSQCWVYRGGNCFVELMGMSWRRRTDLHSDVQWRNRVYDFLVGDAGERASSPAAEGPVQRTTESTTVIGGARVMLVDRSFDLRADRCAQSSFEDYAKNECWICRQSCDEWDQWLSCHHLFCRSCSSEMLNRRMPCPLCRVASTSVLRGRAYAEEEEVASGSESESPRTDSLLGVWTTLLSPNPPRRFGQVKSGGTGM